MSITKPLKEGEDYYLDDQGRYVFTKEFHLKRGHCCQSGCLNCPYGYTEKVDPNIPSEFRDSWDSEVYYEEDEDEDVE